MSKVALVTDSTAYIPPELTQELNIHTVPLQLIWGNETLRDGIDIQPDEFYPRLQSSKIHPTTSQPSPATYIELYQRLLDEGHEILSVHISSKLSGTMDSATQAKEHFPGKPIELVDSNTTSMSMGFLVLEAARAAQRGATLAECRALVEKGREHTGVLFAVQTLEYLRRGGRIGGAQAFLGTVLNLKPLLELRNGRIEAVERVRTMNKAVDRLLDLFQQRVGDRRPVRIACVYSSSPEEARLLLERARQRFDPTSIAELLIAPVSPVIGVHVGPGCMGLAFMAGM